MKPYSTTLEHLSDELRRLDLLLRLHLDEWWAENGRGVDEFQGLYISDEEVDRLLWSAHGDESRTNGGSTIGHRVRRGDHELFAYAEKLTREIRERKRRTLEEGTELRLVTLSDRFDLEQLHLDALLIGLAPELDRRYERIYAYLQNDITKPQPTIGFILRILCRSEEERLEARGLFSPRSPLRRHRLLGFSGDDGTTLPSRFVTVDERIVGFLFGDDNVADDLSSLVELSIPEKTIEDLTVDEYRQEQLGRLSGTDGGWDSQRSKPLMACFHGPYGSGKETAVEVVCVEDDTPLLTIDGGALVGADGLDALGLLRREARLQGADLHVMNFDSLSTMTKTEHGTVEDGMDEFTPLLRELDEFDGRVFLTGTEPLPSRLQIQVESHEVATVHFSMPPYELRKQLWDDIDALPEEVDTADLAAKFRLTEGQIANAVSTARILETGQELSTESVYRGCRAQSRGTLDSLARKVEPNYTWEDIVLPADRLDHLREVAAHIKHQGTVYSDWGFEDKFSLGNGLNVLFTGSSGTGKTMAAEIIARDAGLDLYKIDLASVVSKYIGETEKNLGKIFNEAENSDAILLFDEADALFGKRSEVRDSHDRYANIEVNYLLQRVEEHDGTVVLTTNFVGNIDDAFQRRVHVTVDFPRPDRDSREAIWRTVFPEKTPVNELDIEFLSTFGITGGNIKNVALTAAFLAAEVGGPVEMEHVVRALRREFQKTGRLIDPGEFGEYREVIE